MISRTSALHRPVDEAAMSVASGGRYTVNSYCRFCATFCGVTVTVDDGELSRIAGDRDHPLSHGYVCPKGRKMVAVRDDPALLDRPMLRNSRGELTPVGWDTALDDLGERLVDVRDRFGPYAIATYSGTNFDSAGKWACTRFMQAIGSPSSYSSLTIDSIAKVLVPQLMAGRSLSPTLDRERT
ncbi:MAG: molybdopterin-dependent oxidoreductase, partial [Mycetocola sp.]